MKMDLIEKVGQKINQGKLDNGCPTWKLKKWNSKTAIQDNWTNNGLKEMKQ